MKMKHFFFVFGFKYFKAGWLNSFWFLFYEIIYLLFFYMRVNFRDICLHWRCISCIIVWEPLSMKQPNPQEITTKRFFWQEIIANCLHAGEEIHFTIIHELETFFKNVNFTLLCKIKIVLFFEGSINQFHHLSDRWILFNISNNIIYNIFFYLFKFLIVVSNNSKISMKQFKILDSSLFI